MKYSRFSLRKAKSILFMGICMAALSACGGSGGSEDFNVGGGSNGGGTPNPTAGRLIVSSDRTTINQDQTARITVVAVSESNVAQPGVEVFFRATGGILRVVRSTTNEFGEASAILSAQGTPAGNTITVTAETGSGNTLRTADVDVAVITGGGSPSATFAVAGPTILGINESANFTASLADAGTTGVSGRNVSIQVVANPNPNNPSTSRPFGTVSPNTTTTNSNGEVSFVYTPPTGQSGTGFIQINTTDASGNANASRTFSITVGQALSITGPDNITAGSSGSFRATLVNASGDPIVGETLTINSSVGTVAANNLATDSQGRVNFTLNTQAANAGTTATITARAPNTTPVASGTFDVSISGGNTGGNNGSFTFPQNGANFDINVINRAGFNLPGQAGAVANRPVTITASRGQVGEDTQMPGNLAQSNTFTTDGAGNISFRFVSSQAGPATFTASGSGANATLTVNFVPTASTISATAAPTAIAPGQSTTLTATLRDSSGNLLPGSDVNFFVDFDGSRNNNASTAGLSAATATTNAQGRATVNFTAGPNDGSVSLRAAIPNGPGQNLQVSVSQSNPGGGGASFTFVNNNGQFTLNQGNAISFNLEGGAAAANQQVTVSTTLGQVDDNLNSGPAPAASRVFTTDSAGDINFQAISNTRGQATITASGPGGASAQTVVEYIGTPGSISAQPASANLAPNASQLITATVVDSSNQPLEGTQVNFVIDNDASGGSLSATTGTTNNQGRATTTFTAGPNTGTVGIRSTADNGRISAGTQLNVTGTATGGNPRASFTAPASGQEFDINTPVNVVLNVSGGGVSAGEPVDITIGGGELDDDFNAGPAPATSRTFNTDSGGNVRFQIRSATGGTFNISATGANFGSGLSGRFVARPSTFSLQAAPVTLAPNQTSTLTATIRDSSGNPVSRTTVDFIVDFDGTGGGVLTERPDSRTQANGQITAEFTAGPNNGTVELRAVATTSGLNDRVTLTVQ